MIQSSPDKLYYSISEVTELTGIATHILRYWETQFKQLKPRRSKTGVRQYRKRDFELIQLIIELLYHKRFTIEGAKVELQAISKEELKQKPNDKLGVSNTSKQQSVSAKNDLRVTETRTTPSKKPEVSVISELTAEPPAQIGLFDLPADPDSLLYPTDKNYELIINELKKRYLAMPETVRNDYFINLPVRPEEEDDWLIDFLAMSEDDESGARKTGKRNKQLHQENKELRKQLHQIHSDLLALKKLL